MRTPVYPCAHGKPLGLPAAELPPVTVRIEWPLEPVRHVAAARVACRRHRLGRLQAPCARATDEKQFAVPCRRRWGRGLGEAFDERGVQAVVREALPLHQHGPLADRRQIRQADVGPLRNRPHVDQHRSRVTLQPRPRLVHRYRWNVDLTHAAHHLKRLLILRSQAIRMKQSRQDEDLAPKYIKLIYAITPACGPMGKLSRATHTWPLLGI